MDHQRRVEAVVGSCLAEDYFACSSFFGCRQRADVSVSDQATGKKMQGELRRTWSTKEDCSRLKMEDGGDQTRRKVGTTEPEGRRTETLCFLIAATVPMNAAIPEMAMRLCPHA